MGLAPGLLPGRVDPGRRAATVRRRLAGGARGVGPRRRGILQAAADGRIDALVLLGADPLADFPDRDLAERALAGARTVDRGRQFLNESSRQADVVLAAAGFAEVDGTTTNLEGRVSVLHQKVTPPGTARADWMIAAELACASAPTSASTRRGHLGRDRRRRTATGLTAEALEPTRPTAWSCPDGDLDAPSSARRRAARSRCAAAVAAEAARRRRRRRARGRTRPTVAEDAEPDGRADAPSRRPSGVPLIRSPPCGLPPSTLLAAARRHPQALRPRHARAARAVAGRAGARHRAAGQPL